MRDFEMDWHDHLSRTQCSFEIMDQDRNVVLLYYQSRHATTHILDQARDIQRFDFLPGLPRQILVSEGVNRFVGSGTSKVNMLIFELVWNSKRITCGVTYSM